MPSAIFPNFIRPVGEAVSLKQSSSPTSYEGFSEYYVGSGTMALQYALQQVKAEAEKRLALNAGRQQNDQSKQAKPCEILIPAYACPDLVSACIGANVTPVLVDLAPGSPFPSLDAIKEKLTEHTAGVILVNFLGLSPPKDLFDNIKALGLASIEDRAQSFVCAADANQLLGDYVIFSFGKGKPISLLGGGLALSRSVSTTTDSTNDTHEKSITRCSKTPWSFRLKVTLYNIVIQPFFYYWLLKVPGLNIGETQYKTPEPLASMPIFKRSLINTNIEHQNQTNQSAQDRLTQAAISNGLQPIGNTHYKQRLLRLPLLAQNKPHRDTVLRQLNVGGIGASAMYNTPLPNIEGVPLQAVQREMTYTNALDFAERLITLPCHSGMKESDIKHVVSALALTGANK